MSVPVKNFRIFKRCDQTTVLRYFKHNHTKKFEIYLDEQYNIILTYTEQQQKPQYKN